MSNPFEDEGAAQNYHVYRPRYHHLPAAVIRDFVGRDLDNILDVACGTGHSTAALAKIARGRVVGCDLSEAMLKQARESFPWEFVKCPAESLPFSAGDFDLVNISMGFHWVQQEKFLNEAMRILKPDGWLAIDNYGFDGKFSLDEEKQRQHRELFEQYLPPASRRSGYPSDELIKHAGMQLVHEAKYAHTLTMSAGDFASLLMTWSNFQNLTSEEKIPTAQRIHSVYGSIFEGQALDLGFGGTVRLYQFLT